MSEKRYTIKRTSYNGIYYLVNGWKKHNMYEIDEKSVLENIEKAKSLFFKTRGSAKASLTRLSRIIKPRCLDRYEIVEF